jgi:hypothetical protein
MTKKSKKSKTKGPGFQMIVRSDEYMHLLKKPMAQHLMAVIAERAKQNVLGLRQNPDHKVLTASGVYVKLDPGQCLLGDHKNYGMSEGQYRNAKKILRSLGLVEFDGKPNVGTVAKILNKNYVDLGNGDGGEKDEI